MRIYIVTNLINNKQYVGMTSKSLEVRWSGHKADARRNKPFRLHKAIRKYGEDNFKIELLEECSVETLDELGVIESDYIEKLSPEYNMSSGGEGNRGVSMAGEKNGMFGKKHREDSKQKMSDNGGKTKLFGKDNPRFGKPGTFVGKKHTIEARAKMSKPKSVPMPKVVCEHCGKSLPVNTIKRHKRLYHE